MRIRVKNLRDGTSQHQRSQPSLNPAYVSVDEQTLADHLKFVRAYARKLRYFNAHHQPDGTWANFFDLDDDTIQALAHTLEDFDPTHPSGLDALPSKIQAVAAQPHLALLLTFLHLLKYPQQQFRALTQRRLDFYYRQVLRLAEKPAQPDQVHVTFALPAGQTEYRLPQGTRLSAGQDAQGTDLHYATDRDLYLSQTQIASVKTLSLEKDDIDLETIHWGHSRHRNYPHLKAVYGTPEESSEAFEAMLRWAVGHPHQGDPLPLPPGRDAPASGETIVTALIRLVEAIASLSPEQISQARQDYILKQLCFVTLDDFKFCLSTQREQLASYSEDQPASPPPRQRWQQVYQLVEKAYRKKINRDRRAVLKQEHHTHFDRNDPQKGFAALWQLAIGQPVPEDLPPDLDNRFYQETFFLPIEDFKHVMEIQKDDGTEIDDPSWDEVYRLLERAQTKRQGYTYPSIGRTEPKAVRARTLADAEPGQKLTLERFHPFMSKPLTEGAEEKAAPAPSLGIAIVSPLLHLGEGNRTITLTLECQPGSFSREALREQLTENNIPFTLQISTDKEWHTIAETPELLAIEPGNQLRPAAKLSQTYPANRLSIASDQKTIAVSNPRNSSPRIRFDDSAKNTLLVWPNGNVYRTTGVTGNRLAVEYVKKIAPPADGETSILHYGAEGLADALKFKFTLDAAQPAIKPPQAEDSSIPVQTAHPVLKLILKDNAAKDGRETAYYKAFKDLCLEHVRLQVGVEGLKQLQLRNDRTRLNPKSPFEPFEAQPRVGASFYFAHPELVSKPLTSLSLNLTWLGLPENFQTHYHAYSNCGLEPSPPAIGNDSFKVQLEMFRDRTWHPSNLESSSELSKPLFKSQDDKALNPSPLTFANDRLNSLKTEFSAPPEPNPNDDLLEQDAYFRLELAGTDFQHDLYSLVLNKVARAGDQDFVKDKAGNNVKDKNGSDLKINSLTVFPPYTPKVKSFTVDYEAVADFPLQTGDGDPSAGQISQLHPFGYVDLRQASRPDDENKRYYFLPQYNTEGSLFIGLRDATPPQQLTLLFQLISGSGDADLPNPTIHWSYLTGNRWQGFKDDQILSDSTNGLVDSGIVRLTLPEAETSQTTLMPPGLYWLRATVQTNAPAIPEAIDIRTQAVTATFVDQDNDPEHLAQPLAAQAIQALVERLSAIASVEQPYSSFGGRQREPHAAFYTRVSERLRHRQRAVTRWDYERLVLEKFPQIYKAKCLTQAEQPTAPSAAQVTVVVIPNLANTQPFLPLEPKAPQYLLKEIEAYLQAHTSPFVKVVVKNPRYQRIQYRAVVRFRQGYDQGYHLQQLNEALIRFLSPWAYEEQSSISFGSSIHSSEVIHFIDSQPYVDYVANLKLIEVNAESEARDYTVNTSYSVNITNLAQVKTGDAILVSAKSHIIDLATEADYSEEDFEGIDYMIIGVDFVVV